MFAFGYVASLYSIGCTRWPGGLNRLGTYLIEGEVDNPADCLLMRACASALTERVTDFVEVEQFWYAGWQFVWNVGASVVGVKADVNAESLVDG